MSARRCDICDRPLPPRPRTKRGFVVKGTLRTTCSKPCACEKARRCRRIVLEAWA